MTNLVWADTYRNAVHAFGGTTPGPALEELLQEHFTRHPVAVQAAIDKLAARHTAGKVHTPWPLVLKELEREDEREHVTARANPERERDTHLAETYITNAALYTPTETELLDEIFGPHGRLKTWAHDDQLRDRILTHYRNHRPRAIAAEQAARHRATTIRDHRNHNPHPDPKAWITAGGWMTDDLATTLRDQHHVPPADLPALLDYAAQIEARELGST